MEYLTLFSNIFNLPYKVQNINNVYNLIVDFIELCDEKNKTTQILLLIKKNIGLHFYENFLVYCTKKKLGVDFD